MLYQSPVAQTLNVYKILMEKENDKSNYRASMSPNNESKHRQQSTTWLIQVEIKTELH